MFYYFIHGRFDDAEDNATGCNSESPQLPFGGGYLCTLKEGHDGPHIARSLKGYQASAIWDDDRSTDEEGDDA